MGLHTGRLQPCLRIAYLGGHDSDKQSLLLRYEINYGCKKFYDTGPWVQIIILKYYLLFKEREFNSSALFTFWSGGMLVL